MRYLKIWSVFCLIVISGFAASPSVHAMSTLIPGAHSVVVKNYDDLTTNQPEIKKAYLAILSGGDRSLSDWDANGKPSKPAWLIPGDKVPGMQITGMMEDSQFVIRIPEKWNGRLVVGAAGGYGSELAADERLSNFVLTRFNESGGSYAYAYTDKGTRGEVIPGPSGKLSPKGRTALLHEQDSIEEWNMRMRQLTIATQDLLLRLKGQKPMRTYIAGSSNGGYVTRFAIENSGDLYDGGLDWEGVLWTTEVNNISVKADQLRNWRILQNPKSSQEEKALARERYGLPVESDFVMIKQYNNGKGISPDDLRMKYDPAYIHRDWWEYGNYPEDYDRYSWKDRPDTVKQSVAKVALSGDIKKPMISLAGTWDVQIHPLYHALGYGRIIQEKGKGNLHRLYMIEQGTHVDGISGNPIIDPERKIQPIMPYFHQAFDLLVDWVENDNPPPGSKTIPMPSDKNKAISIMTGEEVDKY